MGASLAASYLVEQLELPLIGELRSTEFPCLGVVSNFQPACGARVYGDQVSAYNIHREAVIETADHSIGNAVAHFFS